MPTNDDDVQIVAFHLVVKFDDSYKEDRIVADSQGCVERFLSEDQASIYTD